MKREFGKLSEFKMYCKIYADALKEPLFVIQIGQFFYICDKEFLKKRNQKIYYASKTFDNSGDADLSWRIQGGSKKQRIKDIKSYTVCPRSIAEGVGVDNYRRWLSEVRRFIEGERGVK
jgi:hypothetical protein